MYKVGFLYDGIFLEHRNPAGHPECSERLVHILRRLRGSPVWEHLLQIKPREATIDEITLVHRRDYFDLIANHLPGYLDGDTFLSEVSFSAARLAVGAVLNAIEACREGRIERAFCAVRPPGHHAEAGEAMGFCIFNNVAVGARFAQKSGYKKIFIVDFDVHHGNGTQHFFEKDETVFYFSTHQFPYFPGTGAAGEIGYGRGTGFTRNMPLPRGANDSDFRRIYQEVLPTLVKKFGPDMILVSAGYDLRSDDPLADLKVTGIGIKEIVSGILSVGKIPMVFSLEGGYNLDELAESVEITLQELLTGK